MTEPTAIAAPVPAPKGAAEAHARGFSGVMGALAGATAGAIFGAIWGKAAGTSIKIRSVTVAAVGGIAGAILSDRTWQSPPRSHTDTPMADPDFAAPTHAGRLEAARAVEAEASQAL